MINASCLCGGVSYEISGSIRIPRYCHCVNCRKFSGTAFAAWGLIDTSQLKILTPEPTITKYNSGGGLRAFCRRCGAPLWYEPAGMPQFRGIPLGAIDAGTVPEPEIRVWTKSNAGWAAVPDDLPHYETHP